MKRQLSLVLLVAAAVAFAACGRGSGGSPTCGIAAIAGPALITSQLTNARAVLTDPPRGLPDSLPAIVIQLKSRDTGALIVGRDAEGRVSMQYRGQGFPPRGYGLLVVDDTSQRAMGVLILDQEEPQGHPAIGTVIGSSTALNLYGVKVDWASVSNPRCPLFGGPASTTT
ncbi:MAG TPA: hypothetical protein VGQ48_10775 [Gemmatimonadales bacterium]|jgi:hypothetical protein|nr:hypothetical protein [Gemmatimonadales bacterium]